MPRLFTGLELPPEVRAALAKVRLPLPGARWIEPENYHLTLRFFGDIDNRTARELDDFLGQIEMDGFSIRITGLGAFGGNNPRAIWAAIAPSPELQALAQANERAARAVGLPPERRNFQPHITLARLKNSSPQAVARLLQRHGGLRTDPVWVDRFVLFGSKPRTGGGPYTIEQTYQLGGFGWDTSDEEEFTGDKRW